MNTIRFGRAFGYGRVIPTISLLTAFALAVPLAPLGCAPAEEEPTVSSDDAELDRGNAMTVPAGDEARGLGVTSWKVSSLLGTLKVVGKGDHGHVVVFYFDVLTAADGSAVANISSGSGSVTIRAHGSHGDATGRVVERTMSEDDQHRWSAFSSDLDASLHQPRAAASDACSLAMQAYAEDMAGIAIACAAAVLSGGTLSAVAAAGIVLLAAKAGTDKQKMDLACSVK